MFKIQHKQSGTLMSYLNTYLNYICDRAVLPERNEVHQKFALSTPRRREQTNKFSGDSGFSEGSKDQEL